MPQQEPPPSKDRRLPADEQVLRSLRREHVMGDPPTLKVSSVVFAGHYPSVDRRNLLRPAPGPRALALHPGHDCVVAFPVEVVERVSVTRNGPRPTTIGQATVFADPIDGNEAHARIALVDAGGDVVAAGRYKNQMRRFKHNLAHQVNVALGAADAEWLVRPPRPG